MLVAISQEAANEWRTFAAIASASLAFLALMVSLANRRTAKKALSLSEAQEERRAARLDLSLDESVAWRADSGGGRYVGMKVTAVNASDRDGALVRADLHVTYESTAGHSHLVKIPHTGDASIPGRGESLRLPASLANNGALSGWLVFEIAPGLLGGGHASRYDAVVSDSRGLVEVVQAAVLHDIGSDAGA